MLMTELVVVAGATGYVGRHLVVGLSDRGYRVRAIVRSRTRAERPGAYGAPSLTGHVAEWCEGDVIDPGFVVGLCDGADRVVSALGVTRQKASPWDVDYLANLRLLHEAEQGSVRSFLYINVMHADSGRSLILRSKAAFTQVLNRSSVSHQIINPSGYFSDVGDFLAMARSGVIVLHPPAGAVSHRSTAPTWPASASITSATRAVRGTSAAQMHSATPISQNSPPLQSESVAGQSNYRQLW